ncbi:hypothetical protein H1D32_09195 [Anaerobacillus sp. CMMVII]|uniref:hypothetical protein n=1 Tax=Anaerobacillus sp. CMMVII TaxID=2755588 RepID=UPI0021B809A5|nr:hypothetical protein [Anaerobacillus sp. CMMVII]MCT8137912.1 hypothetical protein [Anaerobacillus sp. CMMVII]
MPKYSFSLLLIICIFTGWYFFSLSTEAKKPFVVEEMNYPTIEAALVTVEDDKVEIFQTGMNGDLHYVVYTINHDQLITELFYQSKEGFKRVQDSRLIIGGTPLREAEHKIRTFLVTDGPWVDHRMPFTYVTFGFVQKPQQVDSVEIRYQGQYKKVSLKSQTFFYDRFFHLAVGNVTTNYFL